MVNVSRPVLFGCVLVIAAAVGTGGVGAAGTATGGAATAFDIGAEPAQPTVAQNDTEPEPTGPIFEIQTVKTNLPIQAGETVEVTITVENVGDEPGEKEVWFNLDEYYKDDADLQLSPNESETVTLTYVSKSENAGDWTLLVETPDDSLTRSVTIESPAQTRNTGTSYGGYDGHPDFVITEFHVNESVLAGETLRMNATVENAGSDLGEKLVWFTLDGETINETIIELPEGDAATVSTELNTSIDNFGNHTITANTSDDVVRQRVEFIEPIPEYELQSVEVPDRSPAGEPVTVNATVGNVGDISGTVPVRLLIDGHFIDEERTEVALNGSSTVELQYRSNTWTTGDLNVTITAGEHNVSRTVTVFEPEITPATEPPTAESATPTTTEPIETETSEPTTAAPEPSWPGPDLGLSALVVTLFAGAFAVTRWR